jgi:hypothetical protein
VPPSSAFAIVAGLVSAGLYLSLLSGLPGMVVIAYFVQLPLMVTGFCLGAGATVMAAAGGIVATGLIAGIVAAALFAVIQSAPAVFVVRQALLSREVDGRTEWFPAGLLLAQLTIVAALAVVVGFVAFLGEPEGLKGAVESYLIAALETFAGSFEGELPVSEVRGWSFLIPGLMAVSWLLMTLINGILAQALAVRLGWNRRPWPALVELELPWWLWPALGGAALLALIGGDAGFGYLGRATIVVLIVPYVLLGLTVVHAWAGRRSHPRMMLSAVYLSLLLLGWPILLVILLGFAEDSVGLRQRFT